MYLYAQNAYFRRKNYAIVAGTHRNNANHFLVNWYNNIIHYLEKYKSFQRKRYRQRLHRNIACKYYPGNILNNLAPFQ